jgi:folate-binding protein YgfZ
VPRASTSLGTNEVGFDRRTSYLLNMPATTLPDRALLRLAGEDVRGFLQGLITNDAAAVTAERPLWAGLLSPQGKALFDFILWADGEDLLIDCEAEFADELVRRLGMYRLRRKIVIAKEEGLAVHWAAGGEEGAADPRLPELGRRWLAVPGAPAAGWLDHRLRRGVAEGRAELGFDKTLWLECNAAELNGVSFTKGCYVGQENTARMNYRSKVNRRLVVVPCGSPGPRTRVHYPELSLAVEHRRIDDLGDALMPPWLTAALS